MLFHVSFLIPSFLHVFAIFMSMSFCVFVCLFYGFSLFLLSLCLLFLFVSFMSFCVFLCIFYGFSPFLLSFPHQYVFPLFVQFSLLGRMRDKVSVEICLMTDRARALLFTKITKPAKILFTKVIKKPAKIGLFSLIMTGRMEWFKWLTEY